MSKEILKEKLKTIRILVEECLVECDASVTKHTRSADVGAPQKSAEDIALQIVNKIGDSDEDGAIQKNILDKRSAEGKILLCFYTSYKHLGNKWLTSGNVEKITAELGVKIDKRNVTNYVKALRQYLESGATRKAGQPTPYRLNRKGIKRFEEIIHAKES